MKKRKGLAKRSLCILLTLLLAAGFIGLQLFGSEIKAANSITKLEEGLYSMEYVGDYGFSEFIGQGGADSDAAVAAYLSSFLSHGLYRTDLQTKEAGCSTLCIEDSKGTVLFGRNFDWSECSAIIVHTKPRDAYESVSTCCLDFLGFGEGFSPDSSVMNRIQALAAVYVPLDGMNEKGLMVADLMAGDDEETHQDNGNPDLTTTTAIRLLLDRAADVDEAIALLGQYDMHSSMSSAHHLAIADASGRSVAVEYIDGEMLVTPTRAVTNHYLGDCQKQGVGSEQSHIRFDALSLCEAPADSFGMKDILESVAQKNYPQTEGSYEKTMWSIVYIPGGLCADFYFGENYSHSYGLILLEKGGSFVKR